MPSTAMWKLRRLAPRAKRIQARRSGDSPVLGAYSTTLPGKVDAFVLAYDSAAKYENKWRREMKEGKTAVGLLLKEIRSWLPLVLRDVPDFDPSTFGDKPDVPDDVIEDGGRLIELLDEATTAEGKPLEYAVTAGGALNDALAAANKEWAEAENADSAYQQLLRDVRATGAVLDTELQAFRRSLGHVAGRNDKDYQKLRVERASHVDDEDDQNAPAVPEPVEPAGAGAPTP